jgi:hypothetical protein
LHGVPMNISRSLLLTSAAIFLTFGNAHAQYAYVTHPDVVVESQTTVAVLPANPFRVFVYCTIASPKKGDPFAPSVVTMGNATSAVAIQYPDRRPQPWGNAGKVWVFSDQAALVSCTELVRRTGRGSKE